MVLKKPVLADRIKQEIADIELECRAEGHDLAERLALELHQARRALAIIQQARVVEPGSAEQYVVQLHTARIAAFEVELLKHAELLTA